MANTVECGAYTRPLAIIQGQTFSSWHNMGRRVLKGGLLVSYNAMQPWDATLHIILGAQCSCACALG